MSLDPAAYRRQQDNIQLVANLLVGDLFDDLDELILMAERSLSVGPVLHPSEFLAGAGAVLAVIADARALQAARSAIRKRLEQ